MFAAFRPAAFRPATLLALVTIFGCGIARAQPQLPDYAPAVAGHARYTDAKTPTPAGLPAATIEVWLKNVKVMETQTDDDGAFRLDRLPYPAGARDGFVVLARPSAQDVDLGSAATAFLVAPRDFKADKAATSRVADVDLLLKPALTQSVLVVALADSAPLSGATVSVLELTVAAPNGHGQWTLPASGIRSQMSDAKGLVTFAGVPSGARAQVQARKAEYADNIVDMRPDWKFATMPMAQESRVFGRVTLGGEEPLGNTDWQVKMQGLKGPWRSNWRVGNLNARGEYVIQNVAPPTVIGEATYGINLQFKNADPTPEIHADYVPPSGGWDMMVSVKRDGKTRRYISYVEALQHGLVFGEGSDVRHDFDLAPMALIVGKTTPGASISYANPRSIYGAWRQKADENGRFEVPVPVGDLKLQVGKVALELKDLKAHENRDITEQLGAQKQVEAFQKAVN